MSLKMSQYRCEFCDKSFTIKGNLVRHIRERHEQNESKYKCEECEYSTSRLDTFQNHKSNHSKKKANLESNNIVCAMCTYTCFTHNVLLQHYKTKHDIIISNKECFVFKSKEHFYEWKLSVEHMDKNQFVAKRGRTYDVNGMSKVQYFCFRDGIFKSKGSKVRHEKIKGSNKINGHCPARMDVHFHPSGEVKVDFFKTHVGHESELRRMRLSKDEREKIAKSIALKIPFDRILDNLRATTSMDGVELHDLITRRDLQNIARDYNLKAEHVIHNKEIAGAYSWIEEMQKTGKNIVFYKAEGSISQEFPLLRKGDFVLIIMNERQCKMLKQYGEKCVCIDSIYQLNSCSFELTTLIVLDDHNQGFPCTFMFSNRSDCDILEILLLNVRNVLGDRIKTEVFMSDMADKYYNAWLTVMEQPMSRLFCSWLVDRAWRENLCKIKSNKEKQEDIYKVLRNLMEERDQDQFGIMFKEAVNRLKSDSNTAEFSEYFYSEYQQTVSNWAYCHRQHDCLNTNVHLERMHSVIEHIYLKGNKPKRVDFAIKAFMRFLGDKLIYDQKIKSTIQLSAIRQRHISSLQFDVNEVIRSKNFWKIYSKDKSIVYEVTKVNDTCRCDLNCDECKICIHAYICTCPDSAVKFNMCKHIHLVQKFINQELTTYNEENILFINDEDIESVAQITVVSDLSNNDILGNNDLKGRKDVIMNQFLNVLNAANSEDDVELINEMIRQTEVTMQARNSVQQNLMISSVASKELPTKQAIPPLHWYPLHKKKRTS